MVSVARNREPIGPKLPYALTPGLVVPDEAERFVEGLCLGHVGESRGDYGAIAKFARRFRHGPDQPPRGTLATPFGFDEQTFEHCAVIIVSSQGDAADDPVIQPRGQHAPALLGKIMGREHLELFSHPLPSYKRKRLRIVGHYGKQLRGKCRFCPDFHQIHAARSVATKASKDLAGRPSMVGTSGETCASAPWAMAVSIAARTRA